MDLATRIRTELADGKPPEQMVAELVASGMLHPTAQRLVDRAVTAPASPAPAPTDGDKTADDPGGKWTFRRMLFFSALLIPVSIVPTLIGISGPIYLVAALALGVMMFVSCLPLVRSGSIADARRVLKTSVIYLPLLLLAIIVDYSI